MRFLALAVPAVLCATGCAGPSGSPRSPHPSHSSASSAAASAPAPASSPGSASAPSPAPTPPASPPSSAAPSPGTPAAARPTSDADLCARIVTYWSREVLDRDTYGDYQSMGLSHGQYEILRDVVTAARSVKRRQGAAEADKLIVRQAGAACTERYRNGTPAGGPWT